MNADPGRQPQDPRDAEPQRPGPGPADLQIDVGTLDQRRRSGEAIAILDVREPWETALCAIPGSLAIPLGEVPAQLSKIPKDRPVPVLCHHGSRSLRATLWLRGQGYSQAVNVAGGIDAWATSIDPSMRRY